MIKNIVPLLPKHSAKTYKRRDLEDIDTLIIHQTDGSDKGVDSPYSTARYHVDTKSWPGIAYHFYITDDGKVYQTNDLESISYHAAEYNSRAVGITTTGKHRYSSDLTNEEILGKKKYKALVKTINKVKNMLPNKKLNILAHGDVSTSRTDPNLDMDRLKFDVKKKRIWQTAILLLLAIIVLYFAYQIANLK